MSLKKQKQELIDAYFASGDDSLPEDLVVNGIAPFFEMTAKFLKMETAYFWSNPDDDQLALIFLQHPSSPQKIKRTVYFFASSQDAKRHPHFDRNLHRVDKLPMMFALLQLLPEQEMDLIVFYHQKGRLNKSISVEQSDFINDFVTFCQEANVTPSVAKTAPFGLA